MAGEDERVVTEVGVHLERSRQDSPHHVFDELRIMVRLVHDEELVGALEQVVGFARHRAFDDLDEVFGANDFGLRLRDADENASSAALVVRRNRQRVEGAACVVLAKAGIHELVQRVFAHHVLRTRAGSHALGLNAHHVTRPYLVGVRDAHERIGLFAPLAAHRRPSFQSELGAQTHLGTDRMLAANDLAGNRLDQPLDARGPCRRGQHVERSFLQNLGEARHMHAGAVRGEIGNHRKLAVINGRTAVDLQMNDAPHACDAGAIECDSNLGLLGLTVGVETQAAFAPPHLSVGACN